MRRTSTAKWNKRVIIATFFLIFFCKEKHYYYFDVYHFLIYAFVYECTYILSATKNIYLMHCILNR